MRDEIQRRRRHRACGLFLTLAWLAAGPVSVEQEPDAGRKRWEDPAIVERIQKNIETYRKGWLPKEPAELRELYRKRFREIASRYGEKISIFDVVNESQICPKTFPLFTPDRA